MNYLCFAFMQQCPARVLCKDNSVNHILLVLEKHLKSQRNRREVIPSSMWLSSLDEHLYLKIGTSVYHSAILLMPSHFISVN